MFDDYCLMNFIIRRLINCKEYDDVTFLYYYSPYKGNFSYP